MSNRDLVGKGLEQLQQGLRPLVERTMTTAWGPGWIAEKERRDTEKLGPGQRGYHLGDPRFLLRVVTEERELFKPVLPRPGLSLASELRNLGNAYAHEFGSDAFDDFATQRGLQNIAELLDLAGARSEAGAVRGLLSPMGGGGPQQPGHQGPWPGPAQHTATYKRPGFPRTRPRTGCVLGVLAVLAVCALLLSFVTDLVSNLRKEQSQKPREYPTLTLPAGQYLTFADEPPRPRRLPAGQKERGHLTLRSGLLIAPRGTRMVLLKDGARADLALCRAGTPVKDRQISVRRATGREICVFAADDGPIGYFSVRTASRPSRAALTLTLWRKHPPA